MITDEHYRIYKNTLRAMKELGFTRDEAKELAKNEMRAIGIVNTGNFSTMPEDQRKFWANTGKMLDDVFGAVVRANGANGTSASLQAAIAQIRELAEQHIKALVEAEAKAKAEAEKKAPFYIVAGRNGRKKIHLRGEGYVMQLDGKTADFVVCVLNEKIAPLLADEKQNQLPDLA